MCLFYLFLAGLRTSLFSLETASVLSHSNLKIEMSLLGCIAVMAATSFGLLNCAVNTYRCEMSFALSLNSLSGDTGQSGTQLVRDLHKLAKISIG